MEQTKITGKTNQKISTKDLVITGMFTALLCVMAQISIPVQPVPFTLSVFAIFLIGALLPPRFAFLSVLAYVLLGTFGLPVFAGYKGGPQVTTGMTGGFIMAYPVMALVTASAYKYVKRFKIAALTVGMLISLALCYLFGSYWFTLSTGKSFPFALYLPFDCLKIVLAVSVSQIIRNTVFRVYNGK